MHNRRDDTALKLMARDLLALVKHIGWNGETCLEVFYLSIYMSGPSSFTGAVFQELLLLPYRATNPTFLPFRMRHVLKMTCASD